MDEVIGFCVDAQDLVHPAIHDYGASGCRDCDAAASMVARARAELSALRSSPPSVAREFVEAADRVRGCIVFRLRTKEPVLALDVYTREHVTEAVERYDALRPAATGEGDETLERLRRYLQHDTMTCDSISLTMTKQPVPNGRPCTCGLDAAIARAEGRKGTDG